MLKTVSLQYLIGKVNLKGMKKMVKKNAFNAGIFLNDK